MPVKPPPAREDFADELRGLALLGIVLVNAPFLGISTQGFTDASVAGGWDRAAAFVTVAFAQAKFYVLFAFLFGYSLSFLLPAAAPRMALALALRCYRRRLWGLGVLGLLHAALFFIGDILLLYALLGLSLIWLRRHRDRTVWVFAGVASALWAVLLVALWAWVALNPAEAAAEQAREWARSVSAQAALREGSFWAATLARLTLWPDAFGLIATLNGLGVVAMFAVGLIAGRARWLSAPDPQAPRWRWGSRVGAALGLPLALLSAWCVVGPGAKLDASGAREIGGVVLGFLSAPLLTWGYVSWLVQLRARWPQALAFCRRSGRMSLTGYVGESILLSLLFCGYGLGWFGQLGAAATMLVAVAVWLALDLASAAWQARWHQGPLEFALKHWVRYGSTPLDR
jgi:uncharacterized protein